MGSTYSPDGEAQHWFTFFNKADYTGPNAVQLPVTSRSMSINKSLHAAQKTYEMHFPL